MNDNICKQMLEGRELDTGRRVVIVNKVLHFESQAIVKHPFVCRAAGGCHNDSQDGSDGGWRRACCL